jgi:hypothetical protein
VGDRGRGLVPRRAPTALGLLARRAGVGADPAGKRRLAACFWPEREAPAAPILPGVVRRWSVEGTCDERRAPLGGETPRPWSELAIARTTPVLLALCSSGTGRAWKVRPGRALPGPVTAWYPTAEPTVADGLTWGRGPLWRAREVGNSAPAAALKPFPREAFALLLHGFPVAACLAKSDQDLWVAASGYCVLRPSSWVPERWSLVPLPLHPEHPPRHQLLRLGSCPLR